MKMYFIKRNDWLKKIFLMTILVIFLFACSQGGDSPSTSGDSTTPQNPEGYLVKATSLAEISTSSLILAAQNAGFPAAVGQFMKYPIKVFKITYRTTYKGKPILASGLISCPTGVSDALPTLIVANIQSYTDIDAPSEFSLPNHFTPLAAFASAGYFTIIPDMIGYGVSKNTIFPMQNYEHSAIAMIDFIKACDEFFKANKMKVNNKKFLAGYSEGGYTALASLKMIEEKPVSDIKIEATAVGAGGYNLVGLLDKIVLHGDGTYSAPSHIVSLLYSYNVMYDWNRPLTDFFQEPYAGRIPGLLDGTHNREEIDSQLTTDLNRLLNPDFLSALKGHGEEELMNALIENSIDDWTPKGNLMLFHNRYDEKVPFGDTLETYQKMISRGAQNVVLRDTSQFESHVDSGVAFVVIVSLWFESMNQELDPNHFPSGGGFF